MNKITSTCLLLSALALAAGCPASTENQLPTYPVTGKVTQGGAPVPGATVTFSPVTDGIPAAFGRTDASGVYALSTYGTADGAAAGDYKVMVSKSSGGTSSGPAVAHDPTGENTPSGPPAGHGGRAARDGGSGSLLPQQYASATSTPLSTIVEKKQDNVYDIQL